jgi:hypothetical protein
VPFDLSHFHFVSLPGCLARLAPALVASQAPLGQKAQQLDERMWQLAHIFFPLDEETKQEGGQMFNPLVAVICKAKDQVGSARAAGLRCH